jgi:hypothetical protein
MEHRSDRLSTQIHESIRSLSDCHAACLSTVMNHCLEVGGEHARPQHVRLMTDCAAICALAADFLSRKSQFQTAICGLCADICETCAEDCERLGGMEACVQACRGCVARCREIADTEHAEVLAIGSRTPPSA